MIKRASTICTGLVCLAALALGLAPAAVAAPRGGAPAARDALGAIACHQAVAPLRRDVSVQATMRPVTGTRRLEIRFDLNLTVAGQPSTAVVASGLGQWLTPSDPTLGQRPGDIWKLSKAVANLGGGSYRYAVAFRWLGARGKVLKTATLDSSSCAIKELRPDLAVRAVKVRPIAGLAPRDRYLALIVNRGRSAAGPFTVLFDPGVAGVGSQTKPVGPLGPGRRLVVGFGGPACDPASPPTVVADPTGSVDEASRADNALTVTCPAAIPGATFATGPLD